MIPKEECNVLLNTVLSLASQLLEQNKEFYPVGAVMNLDGEAVMTAASDGTEYPDPKAVMALMVAGHQRSAAEGTIKASGIAWNGSAMIGDKKQDTILVSLEHRDGYSVVVGRPYQMDLFKKVTFGELFAGSGRHDIFQARQN